MAHRKYVAEQVHDAPKDPSHFMVHVIFLSLRLEDTENFPLSASYDVLQIYFVIERQNSIDAGRRKIGRLKVI